MTFSLQVQLAAKAKVRQAQDTLKGVLRKHQKQPGSGVLHFILCKAFFRLVPFMISTQRYVFPFLSHSRS